MKAAVAKEVHLRVGDLVSDLRKKSLMIKNGKRLVELFVLGGMQASGKMQIVQNLSDFTHAPKWLDQSVLNSIIETANSELLE